MQRFDSVCGDTWIPTWILLEMKSGGNAFILHLHYIFLEQWLTQVVKTYYDS